jgi:4-alpha-glucanotransferase
VPGPGKCAVRCHRAELGELPIVAEDLGLITPDVVELRDGLGFPA